MTPPTKFPYQMSQDELRVESGRLRLEIDGRWGRERLLNAVEASWRGYGWPINADSSDSSVEPDDTEPVVDSHEPASVDSETHVEVSRAFRLRAFNYPREGSRMPEYVRLPHLGVVKVRRRFGV